MWAENLLAVLVASNLRDELPQGNWTGGGGKINCPTSPLPPVICPKYHSLSSRVKRSDTFVQWFQWAEKICGEKVRRKSWLRTIPGQEDPGSQVKCTSNGSSAVTSGWWFQVGQDSRALTLKIICAKGPVSFVGADLATRKVWLELTEKKNEWVLERDHREQALERCSFTEKKC